MTAKDEIDDSSAPLVEHLVELRTRLVRAGIGVILGMTFFTGAQVGLSGYAALDQLGTANFAGFVSAYFNTREIAPLVAGIAFEFIMWSARNQENALVKVLVDFAMSTVVYFFVGYAVAYGTTFFTGAESLAAKNGYELVKFFFLLTFAAAIPAIVSGGIAERARFGPQLAATFLLVGFIYPFFEGIAWNQAYGIQAWLKASFGEEFHDFAGSVVVHAVGGWIGLAAVLAVSACSTGLNAQDSDNPNNRARDFSKLGAGPTRGKGSGPSLP